jgi:hypothetical protein
MYFDSDQGICFVNPRREFSFMECYSFIKSQISNSKYQGNSKDKNSKTQKMSHWKVLVIEHYNLRFICNLVLGICIFKDEKPK